MATDQFEYHGSTFTVVVNLHGRDLKIFHAHITTAHVLVQKIKSVFTCWGIPGELLSDNELPYSSHEFANFIIDYGIKHTTSSPCYP